MRCIGINELYQQGRINHTESLVEAFQFSYKTDDTEIIKKTEHVLNIFKKNNPNKFYKKAITWCLQELVDNAYTHSFSNTCLLSAQSCHSFTEFCIADCGIGFKESMGIDNVRNAINLATIKGGKGKNSDGFGKGLYGTFELIRKDSSRNQSTVSILSDNVFVEVGSGKTSTIINILCSNWQGAIVTLKLDNNLSYDIATIIGHEPYDTSDLEDFEDLF